MKTYFITGVMGFVGSHWAEKILKNGNKVIGIDIHDDSKHLKDFKNFEFIKDTIIDNKLMLEKHNKSDYVLHLASIAEPDQYMIRPKKIINIAAIAAIDIIDICFKLKKKIFSPRHQKFMVKIIQYLFLKMMTEYWVQQQQRDGAIVLQALVEHYLEASAINDGLDFRIVRLFNVYGPRLKEGLSRNL